MQYDFKKIPLSDQRVWALFGRGDTKGVFQLEKQLGQDWSKRAKPFNVEELGVLISILRPGPLESGMSDQYVRRKHGEEEVHYLHPALEPILKDTYGCLIYQEQAMRIAMELAGMNMVEADTLRKAIGKKKPEVMAEAKKMFMSRAAALGKITELEAEEIFGWIEKSVRYSFNKSHAISYALIAYYCAYQKVHFPREFYTSWLTYSDWKPDQKEEIYELVQNARLNNVSILPPDIRRRNVDFEIIEGGKIVFGLSHIRGVGAASVSAIQSDDVDLSSIVGFVKAFKKLKRNVVEAMVKAGACDCYGLSRTQLLKIVYAIMGRSDKDASEVRPETKALTNIEYRHFLTNIDEMGIKGALYSILTEAQCVRKRIPTIEAKIKYLETEAIDSNRQKAIWESLYLGLNLTCSAADDFEKERGTRTCREIYKLPAKEKLLMHVVVDSIRMRQTSAKSKNPGVDYCYLNVSDNTGALSGIVCWPEKYEQYKDYLKEGVVLSIYGRKDSWNKRDQIVIDKINYIG